MKLERREMFSPAHCPVRKKRPEFCDEKTLSRLHEDKHKEATPEVLQ
jgi:hypothetical protein